MTKNPPPLPIDATEGTGCEISRLYWCPERAFALVLVVATGQRLWLCRDCLRGLRQLGIVYDELDTWRRRFVS